MIKKLHPFYSFFVMTNDKPSFMVSTVITKEETLMKRMHVHITVNELSESIDFYSTIFGSAPTTEHDDYAKWSLTDPKVNFAISTCGDSRGINHLGIQVDSESELQEIAQRLEKAEINHSTQEATSCCYARSNKHWAVDPQGIAWESFRTLSDAAVYDENSKADSEEASSCCTPRSNGQQGDGRIPNENNATGCCS